MQIIIRALVGGLAGAIACAILSGAAFAVGAMSDGTRFGEAAVYGLIAGLLGALFGAVVGLIVGVGKLGALGGGLTGCLMLAALVGFYVLAYGRPGQYLYYLRGSSLIVIVYGLPLILAGIIAALLRRSLNLS